MLVIIYTDFVHTVSALVSEFSNHLTVSDLVLMYYGLSTGILAGTNGLAGLPKNGILFFFRKRTG